MTSVATNDTNDLVGEDSVVIDDLVQEDIDLEKSAEFLSLKLGDLLFQRKNSTMLPSKAVQSPNWNPFTI